MHHHLIEGDRFVPEEIAGIPGRNVPYPIGIGQHIGIASLRGGAPPLIGPAFQNLLPDLCGVVTGHVLIFWVVIEIQFLAHPFKNQAMNAALLIGLLRLFKALLYIQRAEQILGAQRIGFCNQTVSLIDHGIQIHRSLFLIGRQIVIGIIHRDACLLSKFAERGASGRAANLARDGEPVGGSGITALCPAGHLDQQVVCPLSDKLTEHILRLRKGGNRNILVGEHFGFLRGHKDIQSQHRVGFQLILQDPAFQQIRAVGNGHIAVAVFPLPQEGIHRGKAVADGASGVFAHGTGSGQGGIIRPPQLEGGIGAGHPKTIPARPADQIGILRPFPDIAGHGVATVADAEHGKHDILFVGIDILLYPDGIAAENRLFIVRGIVGMLFFKAHQRATAVGEQDESVIRVPSAAKEGSDADSGQEIIAGFPDSILRNGYPQGVILQPILDDNFNADILKHIGDIGAVLPLRNGQAAAFIGINGLIAGICHILGKICTHQGGFHVALQEGKSVDLLLCQLVLFPAAPHMIRGLFHNTQTARTAGHL